MSEFGEVAIVQAIIDLKDAIEAQDPISAAALLTLLKTVDGAGSGLDADLLDGIEGAGFAGAGHGHSYISGGTPKTDVRADDGGITVLFSTGQLVELKANGVVVGAVDVNGLARFESNVVTAGSFAGDLYDDGVAVWDNNILVSAQNEAWIAPTLLNGWVNFGSQYYNAGYRRDVNGMVTLRGLLKSGTSQTLFILPTSYSPQSSLLIATVANGIGTARVKILSDGKVQMPEYSSAWSGLDGVSFFTD